MKAIYRHKLKNVMEKNSVSKNSFTKKPVPKPIIRKRLSKKSESQKTIRALTGHHMNNKFDCAADINTAYIDNRCIDISEYKNEYNGKIFCENGHNLSYISSITNKLPYFRHSRLYKKIIEQHQKQVE